MIWKKLGETRISPQVAPRKGNRAIRRWRNRIPVSGSGGDGKMTYPRTVYEFLKRNGDALSMFVVGFDDYVACRACWRANCLFQAAVLAEQSLEKLFKGGARLSGSTTSFKDMGHRLGSLAQFDWFDTAPYSNLIADLEYHFFNSRYPKTSEDSDVMVCRKGISANEFHQLDELLLGYMDAIPVEERIKHSLGVYAECYNNDVMAEHNHPGIRWEALAWNNGPLARCVTEIKRAVANNKGFLRQHPLPGVFVDQETGPL